MKNYLLLIGFVITLFACDNSENIGSLNSTSDEATLIITTKSDYGVGFAYLTKDKWGEDGRIFEDSTFSGSSVIKVKIGRDQNFSYAIQKRSNDKEIISATLKFKEHNKTKEFTGTGLLYDVYEFYKQIY